MPFGAAFTFDEETEAAVRGLWQQQEDAGLLSFPPGSGFAPHMTLFLAEDGDMDGLRSGLGRFAQSLPPIQVSFLALGVFPAEFGVVYLAPVTNRELLDAHTAAWDAAAPHLTNPFAYYHPGMWVPHVTLAFRLPPEQLGPAAALLASSSWPKTGWITSILFGDFRVEGKSQLESAELSGSA